MKTEFIASNSRGSANHGWLKTHLSFSFSGYHDAKRVHFGMLRVLNDDEVAPRTGFNTHPHDNMEIITIPLEGEITHKDSTGTSAVIKAGEVQIMSAGSGIYHSEHNHHPTDTLRLLQIWVFPKERNISPRYDQKQFDTEDRLNKWQTVVAPNVEGALWINQDAWFSLTELEAGKTIDYTVHNSNSGVYFFLIKGELEMADQKLSTRDALSVSEFEKLSIEAKQDSFLLAIEVPMN